MSYKQIIRALFSMLYVAMLIMLINFISTIPSTQAIAEEAISSDIEIYYEGHRYVLYENGMTWNDAKIECENMGGHLVSITSLGEQQAIESIVKKGTRNIYWLGGYNSNGWKWVTGEPFSYSNWASFQPDNWDYVEDKLQMYRQSNPSASSRLGQWNDLNGDGTCRNDLFFGIQNIGFICEWDSALQSTVTKKNQYTIQVVDGDGNPLSDVSVHYDGVVQTTATDGIVRFDAFTYENPSITVEKTGYISWDNQHSNWTKKSNRFETVVLYSTAYGALKLKSAIYSNHSDYSKSTDLLTETKKISLTTDIPGNLGWLDTGTFYISCLATDTSFVSKYELWQASKLIAESNNGKFTLNLDSFTKGSDCFIRVVGNNSKSMDTHINLTLVEAELNKETNLNLTGGSISFNVGDDVPFIGGSKFDVDLPIRFPVTCYVSENKIRIGFNANLAGGESQDEQFKELKKTISDMKRLAGLGGFSGLNAGKLTGPQTMKYKSFIKDKNGFKFFKGGEINVLGYAEGDFSSCTASGSIVLQGKISPVGFETNMWVVVVPVTIQIKLSLEGTVGFEVSYDWSSATLDGDIHFAPSAKLTLFGGIGVSSLVGVGAYGSAKLDADIEIIPDQEIKKVDLTGELGAKAYLAWFEYSKAFAYNTWHLYTSNKTRGTGIDGLDEDALDPESALYRQLASGLFDASLYRKASLDYLSEEKDMMDSSITEETRRQSRNTDLRSEFSSLIQNTYRNAQPVIVSSGDALYAAFLRADASTDRVYTVVSKYDGTNWNTAVAASSDNTMDSSPDLIVDSAGQIWLAYARTTTGADTSILGYAANQQIVVGQVNPETLAFTESRHYTGTGYAHMHKLSLVNGKPTLVFVDSTITDANSILWPKQSRIYIATCNGTSWQAATLKSSVDHTVTDISTGEVNGTLSISCVVDEDGDSSTNEDRVIYSDMSGSLSSTGMNCTGKITYATLPGTTGMVVLWNNGETICTSTGDTLPLTGINGEYAVVGNCIYYSAVTDTGAELCMVKYESGSWSEPILLTEGSGYFENLNVVQMGGHDYVMGMYTNVTIDDEYVTDSKDLVWTTVAAVSDLVLEGVEYDPEGIAAGDEFPVTLYIRNAGDHDVNSIGVYVNGESIYTSTSPIRMGQSGTVVVTIICPEALTEYAFTIGETGRVDYHPDDNEAALKIGYPDLTVQLSGKLYGRKTMVDCIVKNEGISTTSGIVSIYDEAGNLLKEDVFNSMDAGDVAITSFEYLWTDSSKEGVELTAILTCQKEDLYEFNNYDKIVLEFTGYLQPGIFELVLPNNLTTIEAEAFDGSSINSVKLQDKVTSIGSRAFADCGKLKQIYIPASVTSIAADAFEGTRGLTIYCPANSFAAEYAFTYGIDYIIE